jgi:subtilisin family serine protease
MQRKLPHIGLLACVLAFVAGAQAQVPPHAGAPVEVVVLLAAPSLADAAGPRAVAAARISAEQRRFTAALAAAVPQSSVRWRYRLVANGMAVVVPRDAVARLRALAGVREVVAGATYRPSLDRSPLQIGAPALWAPGLDNAGQGMKIAVIDDGVDQRHRFFDPSGYTMPPGYPKGQRAFTTAKVIVARSFPPPGAEWKNAARPFDPLNSEHGTHVAGIAAGNPATLASDGRRVSGIAPRAYIGNYKALTVPTDAGVGLDGNAAELVAAIEAAVADGMDVINLSIGEPEVEPSRDLVARALDAAAALGVVSVVAAGNDFGQFGRGSIASPGSSEQAITVAAVAAASEGQETSVADFSSAGPTPLSLRLKPDVSAPGVGILSSVPEGWASMSGTSMASPHVAGAAALLLQRHPEWSVAQVKSALVGTADPVRASPGSTPAAVPTRSGGGVVDLREAVQPLVLAMPASVSFGLVRPGAGPTATVLLTDAGLGAGTWTVAVTTALAPPGTTLTVPATVEVPGTLTLAPGVPAEAPEGDLTGWVTLTRDTAVRRIPFWLRVVRPALEGVAVTPLRRPGIFNGNTQGKPALVSSYRYPEVKAGAGVSSVLDGPEQLFRVTLGRPSANFGVVVVRRAAGVRVEPRVVAAGDENRLTGYAALPLNLNPYLAQFGEPVLVAGAVRPAAGSYDIVFDSPGADGAGAFAFRYWVNDVTRPAASLVARRVRAGKPARVRVSDAGSGIDPATIVATVGGRAQTVRLRGGVVSVTTTGLRPGRHRLRLQVSDYQESRNMENVPPILPNTRVLRETVVIER